MDDLRELTGEVKPIPAGQSDEQKIITIPFAGTIRSASYTPNDYLHVAQQGSGVPLRAIRLYLTSPQRTFIQLTKVRHSPIMLYPTQEHHLDLMPPEGGVLDVLRGDVLLWLSESVREKVDRDFRGDTGQKDSGDPGGIVKVVVAVAEGLREV